MGKSRENMLEAFKASHDQTVRNRQVAEAVEAARLVRSGGFGGKAAGQDQLPEHQGLPRVAPGGPRAGAVAPAAGARGGGPDAELHEPVLERVLHQEPGPVQASGHVIPVSEPLRGPLSARSQVTRPKPEAAGLVLPMGLAPFLALQILILGVAFGLGWIVSGADRGAAGDGLASGDAGMVLDSPGTDGAANAGLNSPLRGGRSPAGWSAAGGSENLEGQPNADVGAVLNPASSPADLAFNNPDSRFTVVVAQYSDTPTGRKRAWEAYDFLAGRGLPVVSPRARNRVVFLFVGATADSSALGELLEKVRGQDGARGRGKPFSDAYKDNISRYR